MTNIDKSQWTMIIGGNNTDQPHHPGFAAMQELPSPALRLPEDYDPKTPINGNILLAFKR
ncbi:hypothetical protein Q4489_01485 [Thalassotalea sp. 1_MG-2023]|uniref:hypothetical protein n=1 Tax=Thalassotalea sp. 1_MG-2023 TaxID=3062680 RepID=UPI0026E16F72|nr:hypothetical protein [Thalassotalea sp. 1_MG-2023]MDO6425659.1 hypothetical protein [Thalassotalea sp. 1_MG-2023]